MYKHRKWAVALRMLVITLPWLIASAFEWLADKSFDLLLWLDRILPNTIIEGEE